MIRKYLHNKEYNVSQISRKTDYNRRTVRHHLGVDTMPQKQNLIPKSSELDAFKDYIQGRINAYLGWLSSAHRVLSPPKCNA